MMSAPTTIKATQLPSTGVEVRDRLGPLKFFVAAFLAGSILVKLRERNAALLLGTGKADEIVAAATAEGADSILFEF